MAETVIIGAGIVGVSTAYYLSEHQPGKTIHIVETTDKLFTSSSGSAGGFLARDWFGSAAEDLGRLSYDQHRVLAEKFDGKNNWGYTETMSLSYQLPEVPGATGPRKRAGDWLVSGSSRAEASRSSSAAPSAAASRTVSRAASVTGEEDLDAEDFETKIPVWLKRRKGDNVDVLHDDGTTAQIDPFRYCEFFLRKVQERGVHFHHPARPVSVGVDKHGVLSHIVLAEGSESAGSADAIRQVTVDCTRLIICAGAWSRDVFDQLFLGIQPKYDEDGQPADLDDDEDDDLGLDAAADVDEARRLPISYNAGYSILLRPDAAFKERPPYHALFAAGDILAFSPEMFGRVNGDLYFAGLNSGIIPLPRRPTDAKPQKEKLDSLLHTCETVLGLSAAEFSKLHIVRQCLCFRPTTTWGTPLVVRLPDERLRSAKPNSPTHHIKTKPDAHGGVFLAAGHGPWGISMAPGTGLVLAEMAQGRPISADVYGLDFHD